MSLAWPWGLLGLAALPALVAIYWLRSRAARRPVSSLLLWRTEVPRPAGGRRFERLETPPFFWLEAAALLLLALAAAGPRVPTAEARRPLVVVLDDSLSMSAGGDDSPTRQAHEAVEAEARDARHAEVTVVLAGARPQTLVAGAAFDAALDALRDRLPGAPAADLDAAIAFARDLGGPRARLLVLSDRAPAFPPAEGTAVWKALGERRGNLAVVQAVRSAGAADSEEAVLVEVEAFTTLPTPARLRVAVEGGEPHETALLLAPGEPQRLRLPVDAGRQVEVSVAAEDGRADAQPIDDHVVLLPEPLRPVRVELRIADPALRAAVERALAASGRVRITGEAAELVVRDPSTPLPSDSPFSSHGEGGRGDEDPESESSPPAPLHDWRGGPERWTVTIEGGSASSAFLGPFVVDRRHPLSEGLSLDAVLWAAPPGRTADGRPVIAAGDTPLLVDRETADGGHDLTLRFVFAASSLPRSPDWPILWWNLVEWRAGAAPGPRLANLRLGDGIGFGLPTGVTEAVARGPGEPLRLPAVGGRVRFEPPLAGRYTIEAGGASWPLAVHPLAPAESDLRGGTSGSWGSWDDDAGAVTAWRGLGWIPGLLALLVLGVHLALLTRRSSR